MARSSKKTIMQKFISPLLPVALGASLLIIAGCQSTSSSSSSSPSMPSSSSSSSSAPPSRPSSSSSSSSSSSQSSQKFFVASSSSSSSSASSSSSPSSKQVAHLQAAAHPAAPALRPVCRVVPRVCQARQACLLSAVVAATRAVTASLPKANKAGLKAVIHPLQMVALSLYLRLQAARDPLAVIRLLVIAALKMPVPMVRQNTGQTGSQAGSQNGGQSSQGATEWC